MSQYVAGPDAGVLVEDPAQLIEYFFDAGKPREDWRIGTEYEILGVSRKSGRAARYSGRRGIENILRGLADSLEWEPQEEDGHILALQGERANIALEPGAQLELSGEQCATVHCAEEELRRHLKHLLPIAHDLEIDFINLGVQPVSPLDDIQWIPKKRYGIMGPYMGKVGSLGHDMMKKTASIQVNFDFADEADAMAKFKISMGLVPLLTAMFANSPISNGRLNGFMSMRGHIWTDTDTQRCGILPFVFSDNPSFEDYVAYALTIPMYFVVRDGQYVNMTHLTFEQFLENGFEDQRATMEDWAIHLTTLFPEVRIKKYLEIRCFDNQPFENMLAVPALAKGIFFDNDTLLAAWDLVKKWSWEERLDAYHQSHRSALGTIVGGQRLTDLAKELIVIAWEGLERQNDLNDDGEKETVFLERLRDEVAKGFCPAYRVVEKWMGRWNYNKHLLVDGTAYRTDNDD